MGDYNDSIYHKLMEVLDSKRKAFRLSIEKKIPKEYYINEIGWFTAEKYNGKHSVYILIRMKDRPWEYTNGHVFYDSKNNKILNIDLIGFEYENEELKIVF